MIRKTQRKYPNPVIACFDPSSTAFGWAIIDTTSKNKVIEAGCIVTKPSNKKMKIRASDDKIRRINEMDQVMETLLKKYTIVYIVAEQPHGSQSSSAAVWLGIMLAFVQGLGNHYNIGIEWYSEADAKKCIFGSREATKQEMINEMSKKYDVPWTKVKFRDEAIADALSMHYVAKSQSPIVKYLNI